MPPWARRPCSGSRRSGGGAFAAQPVLAIHDLPDAGAGDAASNSVRHLIEAWNAQPLAEIDPELSPEERATLERHPILGEEILSGFKRLSGLLPIVRHHHERLDGSGYPDLKLPLGNPFVVKDIFTDFKRHDLGTNFYERNARARVVRDGVVVYEGRIGSLRHHLRELQGIERVPARPLEEHGPHLPLDADSIQAVATCEEVADRMDALLAPLLAYGNCSSTRSVVRTGPRATVETRTPRASARTAS